ncbi:MAG: M23 family metallopeptidase [Clostridiales bacterium]|nr:M23 family metallopeptidase [Clostridiales bacterium]
MRQAKKQKDKTATALVLCFCMMALISVFAVMAAIDKVQDNMKSQRAADVVKKKAIEEEPSTANVVDSRNSDGSQPQTASRYILPVEGEIIMEHSVDMPIYWKTLDQYMTHSGIDIASPVNTEVRAIAGGTVTKIEENDRFGTVVEINHGDGIISVYGNLANEGLIELGEIIAQGDAVGLVGQSAMFEFSSPDHLHFEILRDGGPVDPRDYLHF